MFIHDDDDDDDDNLKERKKNITLVSYTLLARYQFLNCLQPCESRHPNKKKKEKRRLFTQIQIDTVSRKDQCPEGSRYHDDDHHHTRKGGSEF